MNKPDYFDEIQSEAVKRWNTFAEMPDIYGPWNQLFRQLKNPWHVLSELLQNADDANATEANVSIRGNVFTFSHNGEDFAKEHFRSICRFGYSNKRNLYTIGFRGIGFKSTFSLGSLVELYSPTLSVHFHESKFTFPQWVPYPSDIDLKRTTIRIQMSSDAVVHQMHGHIKKWVENPFSLLFFRSLRRFETEEKIVSWKDSGEGPVPNSRWMTSHDEDRVLKIQSQPIEFPIEALEEIKEERNVGTDSEESFTLPPIRIDLVLGKRVAPVIYTVLPTDLETDLPFAINGPFILDPARLKLKNPLQSATNQFILKQAGRLAASVMQQWVCNTYVALTDRANAYDLMPDTTVNETSMKGLVGQMVGEVFDTEIYNTSIVLDTNGDVHPRDGVIGLPKKILEIWKPYQIVSFFSRTTTNTICEHISEKNKDKLAKRKWISVVNETEFFEALLKKSFPKPDSWEGLMRLWIMLEEKIRQLENKREFYGELPKYRVFPVFGEQTLFASNEVYYVKNLGGINKQDAAFLKNHYKAIDSEWFTFIQQLSKRSVAEKRKNETLWRVLKKFEKDSPISTEELLHKISSEFAPPDKYVGNWIRLAHIAAHLQIEVTKDFPFVTQNLHIANSSTDIIVKQRDLYDLLPPDLVEKHTLYEDYFRNFNSCTQEEWERWLTGNKSNLNYFIMPEEIKYHNNQDKSEIQKWIQQRGGTVSNIPAANKYEMNDWDFNEILWKHWEKLAIEDESTWERLIIAISKEPALRHRSDIKVRGYISRTTHTIVINSEVSAYKDDAVWKPENYAFPTWIQRFRSKKCLRDTSGILRMPAELTIRTKATESLLGISPFLDKDLDTPNLMYLWRKFGLIDRPLSADLLLTRLRQTVAISPVHMPALENVFKSLSDLTYHGTDELKKECRNTFEKEKLIYASDGKFYSANEISLFEGDFKILPCVYKQWVDLPIWRIVGVAETPTEEQFFSWFRGLENLPLSEEIRNRVKKLLQRYPTKIYHELQLWLSVDGMVQSTVFFEYILTSKSFETKHFYSDTKQTTADFTMLDPLQVFTEFNILRDLGKVVHSAVEDRKHIRKKQKPLWFTEFLQLIRRVQLDDQHQTDQIRRKCKDLENANVGEIPSLQVTPRINRVPVGTTGAVSINWDGEYILFQQGKSNQVKLWTDLLGDLLPVPKVREAVSFCFDRKSKQIEEYFEQNYVLLPSEISHPKTVQQKFTNPEDQLIAEHDDSGNGALNITDPIKIPKAHDALITSPKKTPEPESPKANRTVKRRELKRSLMYHWAVNQGFKADSKGEVFHSLNRENPAYIEEAEDIEQLYEMYDVNNAVIYRFYCLDQPFTTQSVEIPTDVWNMLDHRPELFSFLFSEFEGGAEEWKGLNIKELVKKGELNVYASSYNIPRRKT
jgi:hypothetical protein